jgi:hypothetical protein
MNIIRNFCFMFATALTCAFSTLAAAPSPAGTWQVSANGFTGTMALQVNAAGQVNGFFLGDPIDGFWDSNSGKIQFFRAIGGNIASTPPQSIQVYVGYLLDSPSPISQPLAGYFEAFSGTGGSAPRSVFGWFATRQFTFYCPSWPKTICPVV